MTIEQKALALVRITDPEARNLDECMEHELREALCRAIEQHEAFRQEVSDAVEWVVNSTYMPAPSEHKLRRFIIAKPDPLVEAAQEVAAAEAKKFGLELKDYAVEQEWADNIRAALEARGWQVGPIVKKEAVNG